MTDTPAEVVESAEPRRSPRRWRRMTIILAVTLLLFGVPWWTLLTPSAAWPTAVFVTGTLLFAAAFAAMPTLMVFGHGRRHLDWAAATGDTLLGTAWVMFVWSTLGQLAKVILLIAGVEDPTRSRLVAVAVLGSVVVLLMWGYLEAMRIPRVKNVDVADGTVDVREPQARPLASVEATSFRVYVTGNHEYFSEAHGWLDYMESIGWAVLHNQHVIVERGGDRLVVAGVDDATAHAAGVRGHGANLEAALAEADRTLPILLLAHQPKQVAHAMRAGVDLQLSGHTHGGQIWPFNLL